jgi:hypothetical protein
MAKSAKCRHLDGSCYLANTPRQIFPLEICHSYCNWGRCSGPWSPPGLFDTPFGILPKRSGKQPRRAGIPDAPRSMSARSLVRMDS